jgi:hypothetical protein
MWSIETLRVSANSSSAIVHANKQFEKHNEIRSLVSNMHTHSHNEFSNCRRETKEQKHQLTRAKPDEIA